MHFSVNCCVNINANVSYFDNHGKTDKTYPAFSDGVSSVGISDLSRLS